MSINALFSKFYTYLFPSKSIKAISTPKTLYDLPNETLQKIANHLPYSDLPSLACSSKLGNSLANQSLRTRLQIFSKAQHAPTIKTAEDNPRIKLFVPDENVNLQEIYRDNPNFKNSIKEIVSYSAIHYAQVKKLLLFIKKKYKNNPFCKPFINQMLAPLEQKYHNYEYEKILKILSRKKLNIKPKDLVDIGLCTAKEMEKILEEGKFSDTKKQFLDKNFLGLFSHGQKISIEAFFNIDDHYIGLGIVNIYKELERLHKLCPANLQAVLD